MGSQVKTIGGGHGTGMLANNFVQWLQNGLTTGSFGGAGPAGAGSMTQTAGLSGLFNDLLSGGAGKVGGALQSIINTQNTQNVNDLRARYGAFGGTGFGTPAAYAEAQYRAQEPAQTTAAIGNLQLSAASPLLSLLGGFAQKGIPQAESVIEPSTLSQVAQGIGSVAGPIASAFSPVTMGAKGVSPDALSSYMQFMMNGPSMISGIGQGNEMPDVFGSLAPVAQPNFGQITM